MNISGSKSALLYKQVRRALQSGRYQPGQRIDPAKLASEFGSSATPVRFALYRLVGEGLIVDCARSGLYVPLPTEVEMRDIYDWMERILLMACALAPVSRTPLVHGPEISSREVDVVKLTWKLFDRMASATRHQSLHQAVKRCNDRLAPIRRAKQGLLKDPFEEYLTLLHPWTNGDQTAIRASLRHYFSYRKELVPQIVDLLNEHSRRLN